MLSEIIIIIKLLIQRERGASYMEAAEKEGETFLYVHVQDDNLFKNCM